MILVGLKELLLQPAALTRGGLTRKLMSVEGWAGLVTEGTELSAQLNRHVIHDIKRLVRVHAEFGQPVPICAYEE
jgi:hypothetical protein